VKLLPYTALVGIFLMLMVGVAGLTTMVLCSCAAAW